MVVLKCYCDKCGKEFEDEYSRAFKISNCFSLSDPSKIMSGNNMFDMILCPKCEEELLVWLGKEEYIKKIHQKPKPPYTILFRDFTV